MDTSFLNEFAKTRLLVAGEVGIDEYLWGDTRRISPEAPVPVVEVESQTNKLGLAANVAQNVVSLGGATTLVTVRGEDADGARLARMMEAAGLGKVEFIEDASRPTLRKVRVIAQKQHVVRVDYERSHALEPRLAKSFTEKICDSIASVDGIIVQDYGKGLWKADTMSFVKQAKSHKKPVFVDPSRQSPLGLYQGVTLLTPNQAEAQQLTGQDGAQLETMARLILEATGAEHSIITCGAAGMVSLSRDKLGLQKIPTFAREVFDVTGAGDTVIAVLSMMYVLGQPLARCMQVANAAAGLVVGRIGASAVSVAELKEELERLHQVGLIKD